MCKAAPALRPMTYLFLLLVHTYIHIQACIASSRLRRTVQLKKGYANIQEIMKAFTPDELYRLKIEFAKAAATAAGATTTTSIPPPASSSGGSSSSSSNQQQQPALLLDHHQKAQGGLTFEQFRQVMVNIHLDHLPLERLFDVFDIDGSNTIDYREFLLGVSKFRLRGTDALKCKKCP